MPFAKRGGYLARAVRPGNFSAVTGACQMVRRDVFEQVEGYNEEFAVGFNDADFCLRVREAGYRTIFTPYAELYHYEFTSRGREEANEDKLRRWKREQAMFMQRCSEFFLDGDSWLGPNLSSDSEHFSLKRLLSYRKRASGFLQVVVLNWFAYVLGLTQKLFGVTVEVWRLIFKLQSQRHLLSISR